MPTAQPPFALTDHRALVTGATKGIGRATTRLLLELGAEVLAVARTAADLEALAEDYGDLGTLHVQAADLAQPAGRAAALDACAARFGDSRPLTTLVNNVGTNVRKGVDDYPLEDLRHLMRVNVAAAFELSKALRSQLARARGASIVNVSSVSSLDVVGLSTVAYAMTKGALDNLTRWLAVAWAGDGIRVNGVHPWYTRTELTAPLLERDGLRRHVERATPLGRVADAEEVAAAIAFLAMPAASYVTGHGLVVDGGYRALGIAPFPGESEQDGRG